MKKSLTIKIPEPCHEDWNKMTSVEKGKFCSVCTKEVIDFTQKSDEELFKFVKNNKNACGRFKTTQLDRPIKLERKSQASLVPYAASLLLPLAMLNTGESYAQGTSKISEKPFISLGIGSSNKFDTTFSVITKGKITDANGQIILGVEVFSKESKKKGFTNLHGRYSIKTPANEIIVFKKEGFITYEVITSAISMGLDIQLEREVKINHVMGRFSPPKETIEVIEETMGDIEVVPEINTEEKVTAIVTKGTVTDDQDLPLPGVNVVVKGTSIGTQTNFNGNYSIEVEPNQVLVFSSVGFETKEITLSNVSNEINLQNGDQAIHK